MDCAYFQQQIEICNADIRQTQESLNRASDPSERARLGALLQVLQQQKLEFASILNKLVGKGGCCTWHCVSSLSNVSSIERWCCMPLLATNIYARCTAWTRLRLHLRFHLVLFTLKMSILCIAVQATSATGSPRYQSRGSARTTRAACQQRLA